MNTYKKSVLLFIICLIAFIKANAAVVDTVITHSTSMHKDIKTVVIKPAGYSTAKKFPVLYLLHGFSGNYSDWILKVPAITKLADQYQVIIVCADGNFAGWYYDSPVNKDWQYETYVGTELVNYVDKHYSTIANRSGRAITGLSMGGHGAMYIAFKHQDTFGAVGSMSGAVDIRPFSDAFGIEQVLGKYSEHPEIWEKNSVINMIYLLKPNSLAITFDCGYDDFLYQVNLAFHNELLMRKIPHDFTVRPGSHTWEYWGNSIVYQMLFFSRYFNKIK
ncbi:alpha/beta hydrolase family protein [Mucilaginibacter sabulilitoris]|uniref:Alpha/beta hydrolase family protein n=1 Tax=Mucilaginibacter sabulilitoris TaxID=1173583 RepID=A0ABZ0TZ61_9SPHI|nr:alpha/beta hydrolase family protein [Mucilaginibacter sabulilitoris]WPU96385.1 alpha/beta hydrolase family protein [Mucilaginibacter sabulilitoris]